MRGTNIIVTSPPKGVMTEGIIDDTSLPGTCMEMVPQTKGQGGRLHWRASSLAQGRPRLIAILREDENQGGIYSKAYVAGTRCRIYIPLFGEEMNVLVDIPGTGTGALGGVTQGEPLEANPDGHFTALGSTTAPVPFVAMETIADQPGITLSPILVWCMRA